VHGRFAPQQHPTSYATSTVDRDTGIIPLSVVLPVSPATVMPKLGVSLTPPDAISVTRIVFRALADAVLCQISLSVKSNSTRSGAAAPPGEVMVEGEMAVPEEETWTSTAN